MCCLKAIFDFLHPTCVDKPNASINMPLVLTARHGLELCTRWHAYWVGLAATTICANDQSMDCPECGSGAILTCYWQCQWTISVCQGQCKGMSHGQFPWIFDRYYYKVAINGVTTRVSSCGNWIPLQSLSPKVMLIVGMSLTIWWASLWGTLLHNAFSWYSDLSISISSCNGPYLS